MRRLGAMCSYRRPRSAVTVQSMSLHISGSYSSSERFSGPAPRALARLVVWASATTAVCACSTFEGLALQDRDAGKAQDLAPRTCRHATVQPPSPLVSIPGEDEFVVAVRSFDFGVTDHGGTQPTADTLGFDLDGHCTGEGEGPSCREPSWADDHPDGVDGRDNAIAGLFAGVDGGSEAAANQSNSVIERGLVTMLIRVRGYNRSPNDSSVQVALFGATTASGDLEHPPVWDGNDAWKALVDWTEPKEGGVGMGVDAGENASVDARYESDRAYVSNGVLVAHFEHALGALAYHFSNAWVQARISDPKAGVGWSLRDGTFAGRLRIDDALAGVEFTPNAMTGQATCTDSTNYMALKRLACRTADIGYESDDPSAPCDAASWAWKFETAAARLSGEVAPTRATDFRQCPVASSPGGDHCSSLESEAP
jgi:hypothetical protein